MPTAEVTVDEWLDRFDRLLGNAGRLTLQRLRRGEYLASVLFAAGGIPAQNAPLITAPTAAGALSELWTAVHA